MIFQIGDLQENHLSLKMSHPTHGTFVPRCFGFIIPHKKMTINKTGHTYLLKPFSCLCFNPMDMLYIPMEEKENFIYYVLFDHTILENNHQQMFYDGGYFDSQMMPKYLQEEIMRLSELFELPKEESFLFLEIKIQSLLMQFHLLKSQEQKTTKCDLIAHYLMDHYKEDLSLEDLSRECHISKYYMVRSFGRETGYTPHLFLNTFRILKAETLLYAGGDVKEVARACGFLDYSTFYRACKRIHSCGPTEIQQKKASL